MNRILFYRLLNRLRHEWVAAARYCHAREEGVLKTHLPALIKGARAQTFPACPVSVHMLLSHETLVMGIWASRSFQHFTQRCWKMVFHDDGSLRDRDAALLRRHFPRGVVLRRAEADCMAEARLAKFPESLRNRQDKVMLLKLFDPFFASEGDRLMLLDSDILFFRKPSEVLDWADAPVPDFRFNPETNSRSSIPSEELQAHYGFSPWQDVNAGLALVPRAGFSLEFLEDYLKEFSSRSINDLWLEQTAYALLASRFGRGGLLSAGYEISYNSTRQQNCIARHYLGAGNSRPHFFREGIITLAPVLLDNAPSTPS